MFKQTSYAKLILQWYDCYQRTLPWRVSDGVPPNPYHVLLSEIMLQQTQVATVIPYFNRFIENFPTINALAKAPLDKVMALWTGLGYYSRARNLHRCAERIIEMGGQIPQELNELKSLPGIGEYTASALLSIVFNQPVVPVDGNVERITARLFGITEPLPRVKPHLATLAKTLNKGREAQERAGDFAQALFDIGATICKPKEPFCLLCPLSKLCIAFKNGIAATLPARLPKVAKPVRYGVYFFVKNQSGKILFRKRPMKGLLAGTLELPGTPWMGDPWLLDRALAEAPCYDKEWIEVGELKHVFTHFTLKISLYKLNKNIPINPLKAEELWYDHEELIHQPFSSLMKKTIALVSTHNKP